MFRFVLIFSVVFVLAGSARGDITAADSACVSADINRDGIVNIADFLILVGQFGSAPPCVAAPDTVYQTRVDTVYITKTGVDTGTVDQAGVEADRAALVALYNATGGGNWKDNTNWLSDKPLGEWYGVETNEQGRVFSLRLFDNRLTGAIPSEIGNLSKLQWLRLFDNRLTGSIPPELGKLKKLEWLLLHINYLSGGDSFRTRKPL